MCANSPVANAVQVGELIAGKYRVEAVLGHGGMGIVVAATDTFLNRRVAVKVLLPHYAENRVAAGRFLREARATAQLNSEHCVRIIEVGQLDNGSPFIAMELLQGIDLGSYVEQHGALPLRLAVDYVLQACEGLAEAHRLGIIHRDVKPSNLFLCHSLASKPIVKILDFGVSKLSLDAEGFGGSLTTTGQTLGSPLYMAPEQMRSSQSADARSDLWGMGVVLFELLTGARPFHADTLTELVLVITQEPPRDPRVLRPDLPEGLCQLVLTALEKDPNRRFQSIGEFASALASFMAQVASPSSPVSAPLGTGRLGTLIVQAPDNLVARQLAEAKAQLPSAEASAEDRAPAVTGAKTSSPWASTKTNTAHKRKNSGLLFGLSFVLLVLAAAAATLLWVRSAPKRDLDDAAIVSAVSELQRSAATEQSVQAQPSLKTIATSSVPPLGSTTITAGTASGGREHDEHGSNSAPHPTAPLEPAEKKPRAQRPAPPRSAPEEPKSAKERLGF